jgi:hypothetical protein
MKGGGISIDGGMVKVDIDDGQVFKYKRNSKNDCVTVINSKGKKLCENFRMGKNKSYVITNDHILRQKPGDKNFFKDEYGNEYYNEFENKKFKKLELNGNQIKVNCTKVKSRSVIINGQLKSHTESIG